MRPDRNWRRIFI